MSAINGNSQKVTLLAAACNQKKRC